MTVNEKKFGPAGTEPGINWISMKKINYTAEFCKAFSRENGPTCSAALRWAEAGWRVFPLRPNEKIPLPGSHGFKDASNALGKVAFRQCWSLNGLPCNLAIATGDGLAVLDVDVKEAKDGFAALAKAGLPRETLDRLGTFTVHTPNGGVHYYFRTSAPIPSRKDVLGTGSGVDVRGDGGYVVVPPSAIDGKVYHTTGAEGAIPISSQLADWATNIAPFLPSGPESPPPQEPHPSSQSVASPEIVERVRSYLAACPPAISGQGGHNTTLRVASALVNGFNLDKQTALRLLTGDWNARCQPPWSTKELRHKVNEVAKLGPPKGKSRGWLLGSEAETLPDIDVDPDDDAIADDSEEMMVERGTVDEDLESVPLPTGIVGETAQWILDRSSKPFRPMAIASALAVWSTLAGRKVAFQNQGPTFYSAFVMASSNGKDGPLMLPKQILTQIGVRNEHFLGRISSWNAAHEKMSACWFHPVMLAIVDEGAGYVGSLLKSEHGAWDYFKAVWSRSEGWIEPQGRVKRSGSVNLQTLHRPAFSMLMGAQPETLGNVVGSSQLEDGLLPRMVWVVRKRFSVDIEFENLDRSIKLQDSVEGQRILSRGRELWDWVNKPGSLKLSQLENRFFETGADEDGDFTELWPEAERFQASPEAEVVFREFAITTQKRIQPAAEGRDSPLGYLWGKAAENARRVALILAAARCAGRPNSSKTIRSDEARWAVRFVEASVRSGIHWAQRFVADTPFQRQANRVLQIIENAPGKTIKHWLLHRKLRYSLKPRELAEVLEALRTAGKIEAISQSTGGRTAIGYRIRAKRR